MFSVATTTTPQSFGSQINSTSKTSTVAVTTVYEATVDSTKHSARPHQIISRETLFVSKPTISVSEEKKGEPQLSASNSTTIETVQVTTQSPQMALTSAAKSIPTGTVASKF